MIIENGVGNANKGLVDANNQVHTFSISEPAVYDAVLKGNAYNVNTGSIGLTSTTESGVLYFKNNEAPSNGESAIVIDAIAIGIDSLGTTSGMSNITVIKNPTTGTIIDNMALVDINSNRNFGSSNELSSVAYKGVEGDTFTDGTDFALFYQNTGTRGYYTLNLLLERGSSIGIKVDTQTSSGTTNLYAALIMHRVDGNNHSA